jgi:molecular chaperone GrpE
MNDVFKPNVPAGAEAGTDDEAAARVASSPGPASALPSDGAAVQSSKPVGEPEAPTAPAAPDPAAPPEPSRPHGDELEEAVEEDGERGADQDPDAAAAADPERQQLAELTARADKADEYLQLAQRTKADFENYRKRAAREAAAAQDRGVAKLAKELLPAVDNLDRALQAAEAAGGAENGEHTLASGIKLVHDDVIAALARVGIEAFSPQGEPFDPQHHEAIAQQPVQGAASGTVVEVYQRGYRLGETVLRPARVVVAA